jgi:hypothetical protein
MKDFNHSIATSGLAILVYQSRHFDRGPAPSGLPRSTDTGQTDAALIRWGILWCVKTGDDEHLSFLND